MKRILVVLLLVAAIIGISCKTGPLIEGEVTQAKVNETLSQIYNQYRGKLDMTGAQEYEIKSGDTLTQITQRYYGGLTDVGKAGASNGFYFPVIMLASDTNIVDPDFIEPGMKLKIPDLKRNLTASSSRKAIKDCLMDVAYVYNRKGNRLTEEGLKELSGSL